MVFDIYWFKYSFEKENRINNYCFNIHNEMSFLEWIELKYLDFNNLPEQILDKPFNQIKYRP